MNGYIPFIHDPKKKEPELLPLYIELEESPPQKEPKKEEKEERGVIIIEMF